MNQGPPDPQAQAGEYEFSEPQNQVLRELFGAMRFVGIALMVLGLLAGGFGVRKMTAGRTDSAVAMALLAVLLFFTGNWTRSASTSVQRIVSSSGNDITNLMAALMALRRVYSLQRTLLIASFVVIGLAVAIAEAAGLALGD